MDLKVKFLKVCEQFDWCNKSKIKFNWK